MTTTMKLKPSNLVKNLPDKPKALYKRNGLKESEKFIFWNDASFQTEMNLNLLDFEMFDSLTNKKTTFSVSQLMPMAGITSSPKWNEMSVEDIISIAKNPTTE